MYGKLFESLYSGSMVGKGCPMFAVWGYVIANMKPERVVKDQGSGKAVGYGAHVDLNPRLLGFILGEKESVIAGVIEKLCEPDPQSRTKQEQGRRLIRLGEFDYRVVNGEHYRKLRTAEERREYQRTKQAEYRSRKKQKSEPLPGEMAAVRAPDRGTAERITEEALPAGAVPKAGEGMPAKAVGREELRARAEAQRRESEARAEAAALAADVPESEAPEAPEDEDLYRQAPD